METYVALLRGIMPTNPNMRNDKLRAVFESLGFTNVRTVISSGNVLFEAGSVTARELESQIETALPKQLGFTSTTIVRRQDQLQHLIELNPFKETLHSSQNYLTVTFLKRPAKLDLKFPYRPEGKSYVLLSMSGQQIFSVVDLTTAKTPDLMGWLEKQFGKDITTRTYKTVGRIVAKMTEK